MIFLVDLDPFEEQVLVCAGEDADGANSFLDTFGEALDPAFRKVVDQAFDAFVEPTRGLVNAVEGLPGIALLLRPFEDTWAYWRTVIHETHHVVHFVSARRNLVGEMEAQAYLQAWLFDQVRRKLQG